MNKRNLNEGQWEDRKQWSLGVGQHRKTFWNRYTYKHRTTVQKIFAAKFTIKYIRVSWSTGVLDSWMSCNFYLLQLQAYYGSLFLSCW
jgi:hypothetical protein